MNETFLTTTINYDNVGGAYIKWTNDTSSDSSSSMHIQYFDEASNEITISSGSLPKFTSILTEAQIPRLVALTEERMENYILDNFDKYYVRELDSYIYQVIHEKTYDIASQVIEEAKDDYYIPDEDDIAEKIMEEVDFDSLCEVVNDILDAPTTVEEMLAEVGMSYRDFI